MSYKSLKSIYKRLLPSGLQRRLEPIARSVVASRYQGNNVKCPVCDRSFSTFIELNNSSGDHVCPKCGSIERQRLLWLYLMTIIDELLSSEGKPCVLHFSPNRFFSDRLRRLVGENYQSTDFETRHCDLNLDITNMDLPDDSQDLIICYHVLEHIEDDRKAMKELRRVLKPGGVLICQVPHREQKTYEDPSITTPDERKTHFGQEDHVRWYGREDFVTRLEKAGFGVSQEKPAMKLSDEKVNRYVVKRNEIIFSGFSE